MWNVNVIRRFKSAIKDSDIKNRYYAPYNKLLTLVFPPDSDYTVAPMTHPIEGNKSIDLSVEYMVTINKNDINMPVLFVEIKDLSNLSKLNKRREAHWQMLDRYQEFANECKLNIFYGISAFGTCISIYKLDMQTHMISPFYEEDNRHYIIDNVPESAWSIDVLDNADQVQAVFSHIMSMCASL
jgi:hypothetical protein